MSSSESLQIADVVNSWGMQKTSGFFFWSVKTWRTPGELAACRNPDNKSGILLVFVPHHHHHHHHQSGHMSLRCQSGSTKKSLIFFATAAWMRSWSESSDSLRRAARRAGTHGCTHGCTHGSRFQNACRTRQLLLFLIRHKFLQT